MGQPPDRTQHSGVRIALLTQHGKERVLAPLFASELGATLDVVRGFDTDALGSFTREIPREGTQVEAARRKAEIAIERSGASLGLGSEGAFVPGPFGLGSFGLCSWNLEILVLVDRSLGIEIVGRAGAPGRHLHATVRTLEELGDFATRAGFPEHGLTLRPDDELDPRVAKGLCDRPALERAFDEALRRSRLGAVFVESELRAHLNPTRMATIGEAARDLVRRMTSACPACGTPGFGLVAYVPGLPCRECGAPTRRPMAEEFGCVRCGHREARVPDGQPEFADPATCDFCNP